MKTSKLSIALLLTLSLLPLAFATTETRYFRSDTATVNGLTTEILGTTNSATFGNRTQQITDVESEYTRYYWGHRTYKRTSAGVETELTSGVSNLFYRTGNGQGWQNVNWSCPQTALSSTDSIVVRLYATVYAGYYEAWNLLDTWQTGQLGTTILNSNPWNFTIYTYLSVTSGPPKRWTGAIYFGNSTYDSRILGFRYGDAAASTTLNLFSSIALDFNVASKKSWTFERNGSASLGFSVNHERALTILRHGSISFFDFSVLSGKGIVFRPLGSIPLNFIVQSFTPWTAPTPLFVLAHHSRMLAILGVLALFVVCIVIGEKQREKQNI